MKSRKALKQTGESSSSKKSKKLRVLEAAESLCKFSRGAFHGMVSQRNRVHSDGKKKQSKSACRNK